MKYNMKLVTTRFKSGGLHEKHVVATWNVGNRLSICLYTQGNQILRVCWLMFNGFEFVAVTLDRINVDVFTVDFTCE